MSKAVREAGMRFGVYYSGALDWTFTREPIEHSKDLIYIRPQTYRYADYVHGFGLKFGIHIIRGIPRQAVHSNVSIFGTGIRAREISVE